VGADGLIKLAGVNEPRFDHDPSTGESLGLLVEESRTNLFTYSEQFDNAAWTKSNLGITTNTSATTAPDGSTNAEKITESLDVGITYHLMNKSGGFSATSGTSYTYSIFAKAAERTKIIIGFDIGSAFSAYQYGLYDLSAGTSSIILGTPTISITSYPNGWYRCSVTAAAIGTGSAQAAIQLYTTANGYIGNGTSGIYIWGAQLEAGAFATSYIPTVASTVTRSADNASMTGTNFSSWYNQSEGTLFAASRINALGRATYPGIAYVDDGTNANSMGFVISDAAIDNLGAEGYVSNINQYYYSSTSAVTPNQLMKIITAYKSNDFASASNVGSNAVQTDTSGSVPTVNRLIIGDLRGNSAKLNGTISQLTYYPRRLTNSQLQNLTK
jgi:hypothetical protein